MMWWTTLVALSLAGAQPIKAPLPILDLPGVVFLEASPVRWHTCALIAVVDQHGYVVTTLVESCPAPLRDEAMNTLQRWDFYPPTEGGLARAEAVPVHFRFISGVVVTDPPPRDTRPRVRVPPAAVPLWPVPPKLKGDAKKAALASGEHGELCTMTLAFDARGQPDAVEILSCSDEAAEIALRRLGRYGVKLIQAEPGDGHRYLFEVWMAAGKGEG